MNGRALAMLLALATFAWSGVGRATSVKVGSKRFPESAILAEIVVRVARDRGIDAVHEQGLGATAVVYQALERAAIDVYPEYTGTLAETAPGGSRPADLPALRRALAPRGIALSEPLGFENTYALAMARSLQERTNVRTLTDLARHPELRLGLSHEFVGRADGYPGLRARYGLHPTEPVQAFDHALSFEALAGGSVDVIDVYSTEAKIEKDRLVVLGDDAKFFPPYEAVLVYRADLPARVPAFAAVLERLAGAIDAPTMRRLNVRAEIDRASYPTIAAEFLGFDGLGRPDRESFTSGLLQSIRRHGPRHVALVVAAIVLSTVVGVPLGVVARYRKRAGTAILAVTGLVQTIPALALFCFFIPVLGIGWVPALVALFLYGLLPIVASTNAGLASIPADLEEAAVALGLSSAERMRHVTFPLAARTILAGIRTSGVVAVGSATIAAFIGAGGFGEPISTGLSLNHVPTILHGAIPAAGLALLVQGAFAVIERVLTPRT